jgi:hypothetical protein
VVERTLSSYTGSKYPTTTEGYMVTTDEPYRVQYGDSTVMVDGEADLIFDDVRIDGYSFWVVRNSTSSGSYLRGYMFNGTEWVEVGE